MFAYVYLGTKNNFKLKSNQFLSLDEQQEKTPHESRFLEATFVRQADDELKKPNSEGGILKWLF